MQHHKDDEALPTYQDKAYEALASAIIQQS